MSILLASILLICTSLSLSAVNAATIYQEPVLLQWYLNRAQNYLANSMSSLSQYSGVLNATTKLSIYADMANSSYQMNQAVGESNPSQFNMSLQSGRISMFLAIRSFYRIALAVAFVHILSAEQEINMTPSYVPPSPDANESLRQAELAYGSNYYPGDLEYQYPGGGYLGSYNWVVDAADVNVTTTRMISGEEALLFGPNNSTPTVVAIADQALKQAQLWNDTQEPKFKQIWLENLTAQTEKIDSVKTSFLYSAIPSAIILGIILIIVILRFSSSVYTWAKRTVRIPKEWKGEFDKKETAILVSPTVMLASACFQLAYEMTQVSAVGMSPTIDVIWREALFGGSLGIFAFISVLANLFRPQRRIAIISVVLVLCAIAFYLIIAHTVYSTFFGS